MMNKRYPEIETLADQLLLKIRKYPNKLFKLENLCRSLKATDDEIDQSIRFLAECDYRLLKRKDSVAFVSAPDYLTATEISYKLKTKKIGQNILSYKSIKSTNDLAMKLAVDNAPEGTIITSEEQTKGKGRLGRSWHSPSGTGIYLSIILRPKLKPEDAPGLSIMTAVALADTITNFGLENVQIKWPNDLLVQRKKCAGILTELSAEQNKINHVVIGVGININQGSGNFPDEIKRTATSLRRSLKRKLNRIEVLKEFLYRFEKEYDKYKSHQLRKSLPKINKYSSLIGREISINAGKETVSGKAIGIDWQGRLEIKTDDAVLRIVAGEVTVIKDS